MRSQLDLERARGRCTVPRPSLQASGVAAAQGGSGLRGVVRVLEVTGTAKDELIAALKLPRRQGRGTAPLPLPPRVWGCRDALPPPAHPDAVFPRGQGSTSF